MKFFLIDKNKTTKELDFIATAKIFESPEKEARTSIPIEDYYKLLNKNKSAFLNATFEEAIHVARKGSRDNITGLLKIIKAIKQNSRQLTEEQIEYLNKLTEWLEQGAIPKKAVKKTLGECNKLGIDMQNPLKVVATLQGNISLSFL